MKLVVMILVWLWPLVLVADPDRVQTRSVVVSNVTYTVTYHLQNPAVYFRPATVPPGQEHYYCEAVVSVGTNVIGRINTSWTEKGCFEDDPLALVQQALAMQRSKQAGEGRKRDDRTGGKNSR